MRGNAIGRILPSPAASLRRVFSAARNQLRNRARGWLGVGMVLLAAGALAACQGSGRSGGGRLDTFDFGNQNTPDQSTPTGAAVKIALLLPLSSKDTRIRSVAKSLKEAAELALFDFSAPNVALVPKDTRGTAAGASFAAQEAIGEGAQLIIGPLIAPAVSAAGTEARKAGVPVLAFSTTESVAGNGVYLLSFPPSIEIDRIVSYAMQRGLKRFAALVPATGYGNVVAGDMTRIVQEKKGTLFTVERFNGGANGLVAPVKRIAGVAGSIDALVIGEGAPNLQVIAREVGKGRRLQLLGTGVWNDPAIASEPALEGAWFPAPGGGSRRSFESRYQSTYGRPPAQIASLAYDAVSLAVALSRSGVPGQMFTEQQLTDPQGFCGADGQFRLRPDGKVDRALAIMEVRGGGFQVIEPAPVNCGSG